MYISIGLLETGIKLNITDALNKVLSSSGFAQLTGGQLREFYSVCLGLRNKVYC